MEETWPIGDKSQKALSGACRSGISRKRLPKMCAHRYLLTFEILSIVLVKNLESISFDRSARACGRDWLTYLLQVWLVVMWTWCCAIVTFCKYPLGRDCAGETCCRRSVVCDCCHRILICRQGDSNSQSILAGPPCRIVSVVKCASYPLSDYRAVSYCKPSLLYQCLCKYSPLKPILSSFKIWRFLLSYCWLVQPPVFFLHRAKVSLSHCTNKI